MTKVVRLPIDQPGAPTLDHRLQAVCDVQQAAGFKLLQVLVIGDSLLVIFQK